MISDGNFKPDKKIMFCLRRQIAANSINSAYEYVFNMKHAFKNPASYSIQWLSCVNNIFLPS